MVAMTLEYCTYMYIKFYPLQLTIIYWFTVSIHLTSYGGTQEVAKQERSLQVEQGYHAAVASGMLSNFPSATQWKHANHQPIIALVSRNPLKANNTHMHFTVSLETNLSCISVAKLHHQFVSIRLWNTLMTYANFLVEIV